VWDATAFWRNRDRLLDGDIAAKSFASVLNLPPDDIREALSLSLITVLQEMGVRVRALDPAGMRQAQPLLNNVSYCENAYECAEGADALVIATEWEQFRALDLERLRDRMACPVVIDLRNVYRPDEMHRHGFAYAASAGRWRHQLLLTPPRSRSGYRLRRGEQAHQAGP
jgi:UDPglucose 6-dehydrogenase